MNTLVLGVAVAVGFLVVPFMVTAFIENRRNARDAVEWLRRHGLLVTASVVQVQTGQDWRYEQGWYRDAWDGTIKQKRCWQMYYEVTAQWMDLRTKHVYTLRGKVWSTAVTGEFAEGHSVRVLIDPRQPNRYSMDVDLLPQGKRGEQP